MRRSPAASQFTDVWLRTGLVGATLGVGIVGALRLYLRRDVGWWIALVPMLALGVFFRGFLDSLHGYRR
jgi:tetrahydromethanopterin S-methyltransferase subunit D